MYLAERAAEEFVFVREMCVERRRPDVGAVEDVLHRDAVVALLLGRREKSIAQDVMRSTRRSVIGVIRTRFPEQLARSRSVPNGMWGFGC